MKRKSMILAGLVLCFVLALGLIGGGSVAEGNPTGHTHDGITFIEWTNELAAQQNGAGKTAYNSLPSLPGSYYLTWTVYLTEPWVVPGTVNLCLEGYSICLDSYATEIAQVVEVTSGTLSLYKSGIIDSDNRSNVIGVKVSGGSFIMYAATIQHNKKSGVYVAEGASFTMYGGEISENRDCGVVNAGVFTMYGGTIKENGLTSPDGCGAGVHNSGIFNMTSGTIEDNKLIYASNGGGIGVYNTGTFTMSGGTIKNNKIEGETNNCDGGGVYNAGTFTMSNCTITGNELGGNEGCQGGGVYNADTGTFTMTNCTVSGNKVTHESEHSEGGGIYNAGTFTMNNGTIEENQAYAGGGGIYNAGTFTMNHGTIGANQAYAGGGVYNAGTFTVSGSATITGNTDISSGNNNVYLEGYKKIRIGGKLTAGASIGVRRPNTGVFTDGFSKTGNNPGEDPTTFFFKDDVNNINVFIEADLATGEARLTGTPRHDDGDGQYAHNGWTGITSLSEITANGYYYLTQDVTLTQGWTLPRERDIHLCLNGHNIILNANGDVITFDYVHTLDLYDCRGGGCIIHGTGYTGRGVVFRGSGIMNMHGGIISGNVIDGSSDGAGVFMDGGEFNLCGGTISGNTSNDLGGGVYVSGGTFNMTCGTISGNKSRNFGGGVAVFNGQFSLSGGLITGNQSTDDYGGGVYVIKEGTFTMSGGEISRNQSRGNGGGICNYGTFTLSGGMISGNQTAAVGFGGGICHLDGTFSLSGSPLVSGNSAGYNRGKDIYLDNNLLITVTGEMSNETPLPLLKEEGKDGVFTNTADTDTAYNEANRFASEDSRYLVGKNTAGQLLLGVPCMLTYYGNNAVRGAVPVDGPYAQGAMVTIPGNTGNLERDGYTFGGWNSQADGQGTPYAAGESFDIATDMSFYAVWIPIPPVEPTIATQPADVEMVYGETGKTVSVSVTADAGTTYTLSYAWFACDSAGVAAAAAETVGTDAAYAIPADLDAGTYYYKCTVTATRDDNGESASVNSSPAAVTVYRAKVIITAKSAEKAYDGTPLTENGITATGLESGDSHAFKVTMTEGSTITDYGKTVANVIATVDGVAVTTGTETTVGNYLVTTADGTLTVQPKSITGATVTLDKTQLTYNGSEQSVKVTGIAIDGLTLTEDDYTVSGETAGPDKGTYTVTVTGKGNYKDSATAEWSIVEKAMTVSVENVKAEYDGQPHDITVIVTDPASGATVKYGTTEGTYDLDASPTLTNAGTLPVYFKVTADNYNDYTGTATITVTKAASAVKTAPKAVENLTEDGKEHELVIAGEADGGTMAYALGNADGATGEYSASIPTGTEGGTYYVWYKVIGDENHNDSKAEYVTSTIRGAISHTVTFKVVHGEWGDELGGRDDRTIFLSGPIGAELRLEFDQIPDVTKPDEGYSMLTGSWDKQPSFILDGQTYGDPITEDTVYTYTYGEIPAAVITKAPVGKKLTYNGKAQELVSAGTAESGTLVYALGNAKGATEKYTETIPAMINAGTYYVWYKAVGDKDHADTEPSCVKAEITGGEEAVTFTRQLYRLVLNREPENLGYDAWVNALASGKTGAVQLIIGFFCSPEYQSQNHTVEDTVCRLYRVILNREPDPEGLQNWAQILAGGTPVTKVIQDMAQTDQFFALCAEYGVDPGIIRGGGEPLPETNPVKIRAYVTACYNGLLGRGPDKDGQESWANALQTGRKNAVQLIAGFMDSEEFKARNLGNGQVVEALYLAMLGRDADAGGLGHWRALLDAGYPVASVINGIANSNEFAAICQDCGIPAGQLPEGELPQQPVSEYTNEEAIRAFTERCYVAVLGRQGDAEGIDSHARMILSGKITPAQLIRSFITSGEFKGKLPGNEEYIKILYRAYLNREEDAEGLAFWLAKLNDGTVNPDQLLGEFENSAEFRAIDQALKNE